MKTMKKALSIFLSVMMVLTAWVFVAPEKAEATVSASDGLPTFTFYVPETIYLDPSDNKTFQYYVDRAHSKDGWLFALSESTNGYYDFICDTATEVTSITCSASNADLSVTSSNTGTLSGQINSGALSAAIDMNATALVSWTVTFKTANGTYTATAYSVAYAPNRNVTVSGATGYDKNSKKAFSSSLIYIQGAQTTNTAVTSFHDSSSEHYYRYQNVSGEHKLDPLVTGISQPDDCNPQSYGSDSSTFTGATASGSYCRCVRKDEYSGSGKWVMHVECNRTPAEIVVDTSRYDNTNQLPNLKLGFLVTDWSSATTRRNWWVSDATNDVTNPNNLGASSNGAVLNYTGDYDGTTTIDLLKHSRWRKDAFCKGIFESKYGTLLKDSADRDTPSCGDDHPGSNIDGNGDDIGKKYLETINYDISGSGATTYRYFRGAASGAQSSSYAMSSVLVILKVTTVSKSDLRSLVNTCVGTYMEPYYTSSTWSTYSTRLQEAYSVLGNPKASASEISTANTNLTNAKNALVRNTGTATVTHKSTTGTVLQTETKTYNYGDTVTAGANTFAGYTYTSANPTALTSKNVKSATLSWTLTYTPNTYTVNYAGNGSTGGSTQSQTLTYDAPATIRNNGFTRAYTVSYNGNSGTPAKDSDTATYTFACWTGSSSTKGYLVDNPGEKSGTGGSSGYTDFAQWTIAAPFAAGEEYTLEFDAYGTGTLINYFYGNSGYLQVAGVTSSNGRTSTASDGNITATMTGSWVHYTIVFTLGSNGNANVAKHVLFRAQQGTGNVIHAKNIKFYQSKFVNGSSLLNLATSGTYTMTAQWNSASVTLPTATRTGYTFAGWYDAATGGTKIGDAGDSYTPTADKTLYAHWTANNYVFDVNGWIEDHVDPDDPIGNLVGSMEGAGTFDVYLNGVLASDGTGVEDYSKQIPYGTTYEIKNITPATGWHYVGLYDGNFTIPGWYSGPSATSLTGTVDENGVFFVLQFDKNTSTLTVNPNGGTWSGSASSQNYTQIYNTTKAIADPTPPEGKHFTGWTLSSGANGSFSNGTYTFGSAHDVTDTLTAQYANHTWNAGTVTTQPTCTAAGVKTFTCTYPGCGATKTESVSADGHAWGAWTKVDDNSHKRVCATDSSHTETEAHSWDEGTITTQPTCTATGVKTYTCSVCSGTKTETVASLDHSWGTPTYTWNSDNTAVTATRVCGRNSDHTETETVSATSATTAPTCTEAGETVYTSASFENSAFEAQTKTEPIPATGHSWGAWTKVDGTNHQRVCGNDASHVETAAHNWNAGDVISSATPTQPGTKRYTCADCGATKNESIEYVAGSIPRSALLGWFFSTSNVWYDAVTENGSGLQSAGGTEPSYNSSLGMTYLTNNHLRIANESMLSGITRDTGLTVSFNYRPNFTGNHRHIVSLGQNSYGQSVNNHLFISGATCHNSSGCFPIVKWVNGSGAESINAYPAGLTPVQGYEYNIVVSIDKDEGIVFYIDGVRYETVYVGSDLSGQIGNIRSFLDEAHTYTNNYIGCSRWTGDPKLEGYLSDMRFYGTASTDTQAANLVIDMMGSSFDLNKPSFNAKAYHQGAETTGAYSNLVYSPIRTTSWSGDGANDNFMNVGRISFKIAIPRDVVMVYDGVHEAYAPITLETKANETGNDSYIIHYADFDNTGSAFELKNVYWQGYSRTWDAWAKDNINTLEQFAAFWHNGGQPDESPNTQRDTSSRFWWNIIKYYGTGNTEDFFEHESNFAFGAKTSWKPSGDRQFRTGTFTSKTDFYTINYQSIYSKIDTVSADYDTYSADGWTYTESSYANYLTYVRRVSLCNPNLYDYSGRGAGDATLLCGHAIKQVATLDPVPVKKTATVKFFSEDGVQQGTDKTVNFGDQVPSAQQPAGPAKAYDDDYHYDFDEWDSITWSEYRDLSSGIVISLDPNYDSEAHSYAAVTAPTYSQNGVGRCSCAKEDTVPALDELITVSPVVGIEEHGVGGSYGVDIREIESDVSGRLVGLVAASDVSDPDLLEASNVGETSLNGDHGSIEIEGSSIKYTQTGMTFDSAEECYAIIEVSGTQDHKYASDTVYTYEKITIVPSQNMLFDDSFGGIIYAPSQKWTTVSSTRPNQAGDEAEQIVGTNYDDSIMYSLGSVHKTTVSASDSGSWPTAEFTFTGTGFDLISVTSNDSGVFSYSIYDTQTNDYAVDANNKRYAKNKLVDTYYGYTYGDLYWNAATRKIVGIGGDPLYIPNEDCPPEEKIVTGNGHYVYTTNSSYAEGGQVKGWLEATSGVNGLYQIPVISRNDLPYGTYRVVVTAMYNQNFAHNNSKSYNLYIDGVRIYNPAQGNETAQTKYNTDGESNPVYTSFRNALNDGYVIAISGGNKLYEDGADNNGIDKNTMSLEAYLKGSPNNELYLLPGGTISFDINGNAYEAIKIGAKSVDGSATTMGVAFGNGSRSFSVNTATEKYYSVKDLIDDSNGTVTITNSGSGILSLTKLMTSVKPSQSSHAPARIMSVSESTFDEALELLEMTEADIAIDEETVETASGEDGTVTITLQTGEDAETIVIRDADGNVVEPDSIDFTIDETGVKSWTIVLTEETEGEFTYTLQAEYENGYTGETEPTTVTVTVSFPEEPITEDPTTDEPTDEGSTTGRLSKIKGIFARFIEFIKRIIAFFR